MIRKPLVTIITPKKVKQGIIPWHGEVGLRLQIFLPVLVSWRLTLTISESPALQPDLKPPTTRIKTKSWTMEYLSYILCGHGPFAL